ncbi:MAG: tRNA pseudouridine(38-40) synthase TruA [Kiloniellales bacterium]|jgi:tRNA pseudouridine38-40 synthase
MTRFKLLIEYDGGPFVGWQHQENGPSVQEALEDAVFGFCGERVRLSAAGRTDAGVHALGQVAHLDLQRETAADKLRDALNAHLRPAPIAVLAAEAAPPDFHARFSATRRSYLYRIANRRAPLALDRGRAWFVPVPLDADAMHEAAQALVGRHDFSSFRAAECQADSPVKTLDRLSVSRHGEELRVDASARSFLHHQVRNLVGSLKLVGQGKWDRAKLDWVLARKDRAAAGPTAPAEGLYLVSVGYD